MKGTSLSWQEAEDLTPYFDRQVRKSLRKKAFFEAADD